MREVSCQPVQIFFDRARREQVAFERLIAGTGVPLERWLDERERVDWSALVVLLRNAREIWSDEQLVETGRDAFRAFRAVALIGRMLFDARSFYEWIFDNQAGAGKQAIDCLDGAIEPLPDGRLKMSMRLHDGYEYCRELFLVCQGSYTNMPKLLGLSPSKVELRLQPWGADFLVTLPEGGGWLRRLWRAFKSPFHTRAIARELQASNQLLHGRYAELEAARTKLEEDAHRLSLINGLGSVLTQHTHLEMLAQIVEGVFQQQFGARCVHVQIAQAGELRELRSPPGEGCDGDDRRIELRMSGKPVGRVLACGGRAPQDELVQALAPWLTIALANAVHVDELRRTHEQLERRVEERTADLRTTAGMLEESLRSLREVDRVKTEFFANVQHELRTPLTLLITPLESLAGDERLPAETREELRGVLRGGYRLLKLVNDVLDISKIEAGRLPLQLGSTDLAFVLREAARPFAAALRARGVALELSVPSALPLVADAERLDQIALNLLSNAGRFTPDGGRVRLLAGLDAAGDHWFEVENSGASIPEEDLGRIFERFVQSSGAPMRRYGTTGLGLSVVKELVELHGGTVAAANVEGGVRFRVTLPPLSAAVSQPPAPVAASAEELLHYMVSDRTPQAGVPLHRLLADPRLHLPTLLIAEDNLELRSYLLRQLAPDFDLIEAADGAQALALARERRPDVVLTDLMMPGLDGLQLCAALKGDPELMSTPVVMLTARSDLQTKLAGLKHGADDYVVKPFHVEELRARLKTQHRMRLLTQQVSHREKLAALGTLVAGVAHEIRNPLNGILNSLRPLRELLPDPSPDVAELLDIALEGCGRVERISAQLLRHAHPGEWTRAEVPIVENVRTAMTLIGFKTQAGPRLVAELDAGADALVSGEAGTLTQVWLNLLDNAIVAAGARGRVTVTAQRAAEGVVVEVADDGPGIAPAHLGRIFDPFFTTRRVGSGTGLGLSFVKQIVEAHGGSIAVSSSVGAGAKFTVTLPVIHPEPRAARAS